MRRSAAAVAAVLVMQGCGGGGSGGSGAAAACTGSCDATPNALSIADVQRVIAQAAGESRARALSSHIVVVDRVGNVLATYEQGTPPATVDIASGLVASGTVAGLDNLRATVPAVQAAIAKAITGAYLSSQGNAFSTRTAGQIIQEHFNPQEARTPSGPLYGVQFSQLSCSDVNRTAAAGTIGPKRSPLGLAGDPGGLPLYKAGVLVGGIGIESNGLYAFDRDIQDIDEDDEENIAAAGATGFEAPDDIRGERITADGRTFRYTDRIALKSDPARAPAFTTISPGRLTTVAGYSTGTIVAGTAFGSAGSGIRADAGPFASLGGWVLVDAANANRFPVRAGSALAASEVQAILAEAFAVARRTRGQIRRPVGTPAEVTVSVVDLNGDVLGLVRTPDGPVFGIDVAVQKARTGMFFSSPAAAAKLAALPPATFLPNNGTRVLASYGDALAAFLGQPAALRGAVAWTPRAIGLLHRPFYPDGIDGTNAGPLSAAVPLWSPFNVGFQLDLAYNQLVKGVLGDTSEGCAGRLAAGATTGSDAGLRELRNGAQIFPGGVPIYRNGVLVGGVGVSGDGVDQDDMVSYLGLANAAAKLGNGVGNAAQDIRADNYSPQGSRLRYVQCPQAPFLDSTVQDACQ